MEKEVVIKRIKELGLKAIDNIVCLLILCGLMIILLFHKIIPFFPVLV